MLLHPSSQDRRSIAGYVADLCPACGLIRACSVDRTEYRVTVTFAPAMPWAVRHHQCTCRTCKARWFVKPEDFLAVSNDPVDIEDLIDSTNPGLRAVNSKLDALTGARIGARTSSTERVDYLVECIRNAGRMIPILKAPDYIAYTMLVVLLALIGKVMFFMALWAGVRALSPTLANQWARAGRVATIAEWLVWLVLVFFMVRWFIQRARKPAYAAIAHAMSRITPTDEEITRAILEGKQRGLSACRFISTGALLRRLNRAR